MGYIFGEDMRLNEIYNGKAEDIILDLDDNSINCVITSPPYNIDMDYDIFSDNEDYQKYIDDLKLVFSRLKPKLKKDARICINIADAKNGRFPTHADIINFMVRELGYLMYTTIVWEKSQIGNRISWGSFNSPSFPSFPTPFEFILVFGNETLKLEHKGQSDLDNKEFIDWSLALWRFAPENKMKKKYNHPAMFPEELPKRCLKMFTYKEDVILDMYSGAGTTCFVSKKMDRKFIGIDVSKEYCEIARNRCNKALTKEEVNLFFEVIYD